MTQAQFQIKSMTFYLIRYYSCAHVPITWWQTCTRGWQVAAENWSCQFQVWLWLPGAWCFPGGFMQCFRGVKRTPFWADGTFRPLLSNLRSFLIVTVPFMRFGSHNTLLILLWGLFSHFSFIVLLIFLCSLFILPLLLPFHLFMHRPPSIRSLSNLNCLLQPLVSSTFPPLFTTFSTSLRSLCNLEAHRSVSP